MDKKLVVQQLRACSCLFIHPVINAQWHAKSGFPITKLGLQFAELAGCKTKSVEEFSVIFAGFNSCKLYFTGPVHMIPLAEMSRLTGRIFPCVHMGRLFKR